MYQCAQCKKELDPIDAYEYRGAVACESCFESVIAARDHEREEVMAEESAKTEKLRGLNFGDNPIGKANRQILKGALEVAGKEGARLRAYEGR
jgi:recombinational DNA repair protein (RecF pathway)